MGKKFKLTKKQKEQLIPFIKRAEEIEDKFYRAINNLEKIMEFETGIEGIEFFMRSNSIVGIGNADRTMELIHLEDII
jgi:hypothetical protein